MQNYHHILIAVDGSRDAEWAFNKAVETAKRNAAHLTIVHIIEGRSFAELNIAERPDIDDVEDYSHQLLEGYRNLAQAAGIAEIDVYSEAGSPDSLIPKKIAVKVGADLIVCGSAGLNAVERFILGSTSESIVRHAKCDVLVVRTETIPDDFEPQLGVK
ncbi:universal stress protein [Macrococcus hajekii]|uniref:Universal stress protein n=1 Tax=Macrococcus hajekii TaxID=198482 RepID=A0A4R6BM99_9STAP|nr:universal stress protein [Macrococcus hajekii]TDM02949.1 universal stress protein [Macrococcus hajekii]GGB05206.1 putative universal stress protein [Macrococcus hajekii]